CRAAGVALACPPGARMPFAAIALTDELTRPSGESCGTCGAPGREPPPSSESGCPNAPCSSDPGGRLSGLRTQSAISLPAGVERASNSDAPLSTRAAFFSSGLHDPPRQHKRCRTLRLLLPRAVRRSAFAKMFERLSGRLTQR